MNFEIEILTALPVDGQEIANLLQKIGCDIEKACVAFGGDFSKMSEIAPDDSLTLEKPNENDTLVLYARRNCAPCGAMTSKKREGYSCSIWFKIPGDSSADATFIDGKNREIYRSAAKFVCENFGDFSIKHAFFGCEMFLPKSVALDEMMEESSALAWLVPSDISIDVPYGFLKVALNRDFLMFEKKQTAVYLDEKDVCGAKKALSLLKGKNLDRFCFLGETLCIPFGNEVKIKIVLPQRSTKTVSEYALHIEGEWQLFDDEKLVFSSADTAEKSHNKLMKLADSIFDNCFKGLFVKDIDVLENGSFSLSFPEDKKILVLADTSFSNEIWRMLDFTEDMQYVFEK
ncbi:MAG: hypothetical protein IKV98_02535 [Clostridia bacterium]|nr:hypothetical protein [Clostridia bacterium]